MAKADGDNQKLLPAVTSFIEYLSAAYSAVGLYGSDHPLAAALAEAVADGVRPLVRESSEETYTFEIGCGMFLWQGQPVPPKLVSQLASDLHSLNAVELVLSGTIDAAVTHTLLTSIYNARRDGGTLDDVTRVADGIARRPIRFVPLAAEALSSHHASVPGERTETARLVSDAELAAMLREPPDDPGVLADRIIDRVESGGGDEIRSWMLAQLDEAVEAGGDHESLRKVWLERCIERLTPEVRASLVRSVPKPDPEWLMTMARLAPVWPIDELLAALENVTGDVTSLRGTGRLLFTQLLGFAHQGEQQSRVRSIIDTWGSNRPDSSLFASGSDSDQGDEFRSEEYAEELLQYATQRTGDAIGVRIDDLENEDRLATRAAEIAIGLAEDAEDPDIAAIGVSRTAEALIRQSRVDLVLKALARDLADDDDPRSLSLRQRRLVAILKKPESVRALLENFSTGADDAGVVRLLDLAGEHAASAVLEFCRTSACEASNVRALAWFRGLAPEVRASAIGEHLSAFPDDVEMLESVCEGIEAFQIGHCIEHLVSVDQPGHTRAVLRVLGWCTGDWPASVVQHVISTSQRDVLTDAIRGLTAGPAQSRSDTIARVLCSLASLRQMSVLPMLPLIQTLRQDQRVAERAFVELLAVIRSRPTMIARGDAEPILQALAGYESLGEPTKRALRQWKSPTVYLLSMFGRLTGPGREARRCA